MLNRVYTLMNPGIPKSGSKRRPPSARVGNATVANSGRGKSTRKKASVVMIPKFKGCGPGGMFGSLVARTQTETSTSATPRQVDEDTGIRMYEEGTADILQQIYDRSNIARKLADLLVEEGGSPRVDPS